MNVQALSTLLLLPLVVADTDPVRNGVDLFAHASAAAARGELERAESDFLELRRIEPRHSIAAYSLACVAARSGQGAKSLEWLSHAVDEGWDDAAVALWDADLALLRAEESFGLLLERMREHAARRSVATEWWFDLPNSVQPRFDTIPFPAVTADGARLLVPRFDRPEDGMLEGVDLATGWRTREWFGVPSGATRVFVGTNGMMLSVTARVSPPIEEQALLWSDADTAPRHRWSAPRHSCCSLRPDGKRALVGDRLWNCETGELAGTLPSDLGSISRHAWSSDSCIVAVGSRRGEVQLLDGDSLAPVRARWHVADESRAERVVTGLEFDPRGRHLAVALWNGWPDAKLQAPTFDRGGSSTHGRHARAGEDIALLDVIDGTVLSWLDEIGLWPNSNVTGLAHSPDGRWLVASDSGDLCGFDLERRQRAWNFISENGGTSLSGCFTFVPGQPRVVLWGRPPAERIFELVNGTSTAHSNGLDAFSQSDGAWAKTTWCASGQQNALVACTGSYASVLDARTLEPRYERVCLGEDAELVRVRCGYVDGSAHGVRLARMRTNAFESSSLSELARYLWDPKRVRAALAGVAVLPPQAPR